jgi:hypothetical protein
MTLSFSPPAIIAYAIGHRSKGLQTRTSNALSVILNLTILPELNHLKQPVTLEPRSLV